MPNQFCWQVYHDRVRILVWGGGRKGGGDPWGGEGGEFHFFLG